MTSWIILVIAGLLETGWAIGMKYSEGFTKLMPSVFTIVTMTVSVFMLAFAMKSLPVGTAYSVWTGIGAGGTVVMGNMLFGDSTSPARVFCVALILIGIIGLKFVSE